MARSNLEFCFRPDFRWTQKNSDEQIISALFARWSVIFKHFINNDLEVERSSLNCHIQIETASVYTRFTKYRKSGILIFFVTVFNLTLTFNLYAHFYQIQPVRVGDLVKTSTKAHFENPQSYPSINPLSLEPQTFYYATFTLKPPLISRYRTNTKRFGTHKGLVENSGPGYAEFCPLSSRKRRLSVNFFVVLKYEFP